jgi:chromate transporter
MPSDFENPKPSNLLVLFCIFSVITLQGFGGVISVMQRDLVDRRGWFSQPEFLDMISLAQVLPGPNVCNLAMMVGDRFFGLRGALSALLGMLLLPMVVILSLSGSYMFIASDTSAAGAIKGMSLVAVGMTLGTALRLFSGINTEVMGRVSPLLIILLVFFMVGYLRVSVVWALLFVGTGSFWWARRSLKLQKNSG